MTRARGDLAGRRAVLAESLRLRRSSRLLADVYMDLLGIARSARLMGKGRRPLVCGGKKTPIARARLCRRWRGKCASGADAAALQEQLGDGQFRPAWDAGTALSIEEAIDEAIVLADELVTERFETSSLTPCRNGSKSSVAKSATWCTPPAETSPKPTCSTTVRTSSCRAPAAHCWRLAKAQARELIHYVPAM